LLPALCLAFLSALASASASGTELPAYKKTPQKLYLTANEAYAMKQAEGGHMALIDVRTRAEIAFVGMASAADANVPFKNVDFGDVNEDKDGFSMRPNPDFSAAVGRVLQRMGLNKNQPIAVMCRSGRRSAAAATLLAEQGYTRVYTITDGFEGDKAQSGPEQGRRVVNGWKNSGAPWTTKIDPDKLY
jgi:rhodanese-related sulfurtransferase